MKGAVGGKREQREQGKERRLGESPRMISVEETKGDDPQPYIRGSKVKSDDTR